ncbi:MAG: alpha/beta hydrolase [Armatimonadetes bacterium]|nr:alpha/beta hydrolase [Armatimonadota bacterium]
MTVLTALLVASVMAPQAIPLWKDLKGGPADTPTLTPFLAEKPNGTAMVILPGGGYGGLADHEGKGYAEFLNTLGISAFVVKYRLGSAGYRHPVEFNDAARAVRMVRASASEWHVKPNQIGLMGSSAGGHLCSTVITHFEGAKPASSDPIEQVSDRPDFAVLCYPVITMGKFTHQGSKENLLGKDPKPYLVTLLSNEKQVKATTPPCFIWHTVDDDAVPVENSIMFAQALRDRKVPFELHLYQTGRHGLGLGDGPPFERVLPWVHDMVAWLKTNHWL